MLSGAVGGPRLPARRPGPGPCRRRASRWHSLAGCQCRGRATSKGAVSEVRDIAVVFRAVCTWLAPLCHLEHSSVAGLRWRCFGGGISCPVALTGMVLDLGRETSLT
jgi:hypothetical protein